MFILVVVSQIVSGGNGCIVVFKFLRNKCLGLLLRFIESKEKLFIKKELTEERGMIKKGTSGPRVRAELIKIVLKDFS